MRRFAFTLLELVFVIIVIGILAVLAMPNFKGNPLQTAAEQVASHIRYTQHLAMIDDAYDPNNSTWYQNKWQIRFRLLMNENGYVIFSDSDTQKGNANNSEMALDPLTGERMNGFDLYKPANLTLSYNIKGDNTGIVQSCFSADGSLVTSNRGVFAFDHLGRPYAGLSNATAPFNYLMTADCNLTLKNNENQTAVITVRPETGYVSVTYL